MWHDAWISAYWHFRICSIESKHYICTIHLQVGVHLSSDLLLIGLQDLLKNCFNNGHHHGDSWGVLDPHGEESSARHEPQYQPRDDRTPSSGNNVHKAPRLLRHPTRPTPGDLTRKDQVKTHHAGLTPTKVTSLKATLRWSPHFAMDVARQMTPTSRKWKSLKYSFAT